MGVCEYASVYHCVGETRSWYHAAGGTMWLVVPCGCREPFSVGHVVFEVGHSHGASGCGCGGV